jgi:L-threonylcarbamoyladenylate synthase
MGTIRLTGSNIKECALRAAEVLRAGGVVLYPTDTLYGLGADAFSDEAVSKIYAIKTREEQKPIHCIVRDVEAGARYAELNDTARKLAKVFLPGPLTIVAEKKDGIDSGIARAIETIGIRVPKNDFCIALAERFGKPYTTTSGNVSGEKTPATVEGVLEQLGPAAKRIDLVVDGGELQRSLPSTVVGVSGEDVVILREGAIPASEIWNALGIGSRQQEA